MAWLRHTGVILIGMLLSVALGGGAQAQPATPSRSGPGPGGVAITWRADDQLPLVAYHGLRLPMRFVAVQASAAGALVPQIQRITAQRSNAVVQPAATTEPATATTGTLPDAPVFVLREAVQRGVRIIVVAISPRYTQDGAAMQATQISALLPHVALFDPNAPIKAVSATGATSPPQNPRAAQQAVKLIVDHGGMQELRGALLPANSLPTTDLAALQIWHAGVVVPLEITDTDQDGRLGPNDRLRFFAPAPGDRWNTTDTYWLVAAPGSTPLRIATEPRAAGSGLALANARQSGIWRSPSIYASRLPGPRGDHWFSLDMRANPPDQPGGTPYLTTATVPFTPTLPTMIGTGNYTLDGAERIHTQHTLRLASDQGTTDLAWYTSGAWTQTATLQQTKPSITLATSDGSKADWFYVDQIAWNVAVALQFAGTGATFETDVAGRYQLGGALPADWAFYSIPMPATTAAPVRLALADTLNHTFQSAAGQRYLVIGPGTLYTPVVQIYTPIDITAALNAQAVYLAPPAFQPALAPLVAYRAAQGYRVAVIDPQTIYDRWSYGQVAPDAIRNFFRAADAGSHTLVAATLVGDGTEDPHDYSGRNAVSAEANLNIIPPYLADVDLWIGETACETCYAQLDGDSPLDDTLPDIALGRLPVKNAGQLAALVAKLLRYEARAPDPANDSRISYISDNYYSYDAAGQVTTDAAGNFSAFADESIKALPRGTRVTRLDYDPTAASGPVREPDALRAYARTLALLDQGAGVVNYIGHGSAEQWATTNLDGSPTSPNGPGYLFSLYDPDRMANGDHMPIVLDLTCRTSAFQTQNNRGTAIDERLVTKADGGAIATWGSSGDGVAHGHDALQRGFYRLLWQRPRYATTLGELTQAGYTELITNAASAEDAVRTFLLLGDPLTTAHVAVARETFLPLTRR